MRPDQTKGYIVDNTNTEIRPRDSDVKSLGR